MSCRKANKCVGDFKDLDHDGLLVLVTPIIVGVNEQDFVAVRVGESMSCRKADNNVNNVGDINNLDHNKP